MKESHTLRHLSPRLQNGFAIFRQGYRMALQSFAKATELQAIIKATEWQVIIKTLRK